MAPHGAENPARDLLRGVCLALFWRVPMLLPLVAVAASVGGLYGADAWGWGVAALTLAVAHTLRLRRVFCCCVVCMGVVVSTQLVRRDCAEELQNLCAGGRAVALQGVVVRELGKGCILETHWTGVRVVLRGEVPWRAGDVVRVVAEPQQVKAPQVPGMFSSAEWMRQQGLAATLSYLHGEKVADSYGWSRMVRYAGGMRRILADCLMPPGSEDDMRRQVLCAMVLGEKERSDAATIELFRRSGCLHAFAVSGLHVGLVGSILWCLLRLLRVPPRAGRIVLLAGVGLYVWATGLAVPALRAYLMLAALVGGLILRRRSSVFNAWCCAATCILLLEPWQLLQPGFQLSFIVYAAICLGVCYGMGDAPWFGPDSYIPARIRTHFERWMLRLELGVRGVVIVALSAWLVSLPFAISQFHAVSTLSYLTNIAIAPLLPVVMLLGLVALALGWVPLLGGMCQYLAVQAAGCLIGVVGLTSQMPGAFLPAVEPAAPRSALVVGLGYGKSFCVLGNPGLLMGDLSRAADARYSIEPVLFHAGYTPALAWGAGEDALSLYRRSWPRLRKVRSGVSYLRYSSPAGEYQLYFPPADLPQHSAANAQPIVLWVRAADGLRVLYLGHAAMSTLESMPPEELRADVVILGTNPKEPLLDTALLRSMSASRVILLPGELQYRISDAELAPARVERLSDSEQPVLQLD